MRYVDYITMGAVILFQYIAIGAHDLWSRLRRYTTHKDGKRAERKRLGHWKDACAKHKITVWDDVENRVRKIRVRDMGDEHLKSTLQDMIRSAIVEHELDGLRLASLLSLEGPYRKFERDRRTNTSYMENLTYPYGYLLTEYCARGLDTMALYKYAEETTKQVYALGQDWFTHRGGLVEGDK